MTDSNHSEKKEYIWQGYDQNAKKVSGVLRVNSITEAKEFLNENQIYLKSIELNENNRPYGRFFSTISNWFKKDRSIELYFFTKQLYSLLSAGINLDKAILSMQKSTKEKRLKNMLTEIHYDLTRGQNFETALSRHQDFFPKIYLALIQVAAQGRKFKETVANLTEYLSKKNRLDNEIKKALLYPKIILLISVSLSIILLVKVVPVFGEIYQNSPNATDLPAFTLLIINLSNLLNNQTEFFLSLCLIFFLSYRFFFSLPQINELIDRLSLRLPVIGDLVIKSNVAHIFRMISTLDQSKLNTVDSIFLVAENTKNKLYQKKLIEIATNIESGMSIWQAFSNNRLFPEYVVQMIHTGENTNQLTVMLDTIANLYESEVSDALDKFKTLIEPLTMLGLSVIVAAIVIGMYLPIFSMGSVI